MRSVNGTLLLLVVFSLHNFITAQPTTGTPVLQVRAWSESWDAHRNTSWLWSTEIRGYQEPITELKQVRIGWPDRFVARRTRPAVPGVQEASSMFGFAADGRLISVDEVNNSHGFAGSGSMLEAIQSVQNTVPVVIAYLVAGSEVALVAEDIVTDEAGRIHWHPATLSGFSYVFAPYDDGIVLAEIHSHTDSDGAKTTSVSRFEYPPVGESRWPGVPAVPSRMLSAVQIENSPLTALITGDDSATSASLSTTHELTEFAVISRDDVGFVDPGDSTSLVKTTGEVYDYEGNVVDRIEPERRTSRAFQWTAVAATVTVAAGLAAVGVFFWQRRSV